MVDNRGSDSQDLGPWIGASPDDQTAQGDFRREVEALTREVLSGFTKRDGRWVPREPGEEDPRTAPAPSELSRGHFDLRRSAPYLLAIASRALGDRLTGRERRSNAFSEDLLLIEIARTHPATLARLRHRFRLPASTVSVTLKRYIDDGLVRRRRHPHDLRTWLIEPTPAGLARADQRVRRWREADEALLRSLSPAERDAFCRLLGSAALAFKAPAAHP